MKNNLLIRIGLSVIMFMHSIPSIISGDVLSFGKDYLGHQGFGFLGLPVAILIKTTHLLSIYTLLVNRFIKWTIIFNCIIFLVGIYMIHWQNGWYVVGGGRNGIEFNFLLLVCFMSLWESE